MVARESIGSWLSGPGGAAPGPGDGEGYPGRRLGRPESGPGAVAGFGRRFAALFVDWSLCLVIAGGLLGGDGRVTLAVFAAENLLLVATLGTTVGKRLLGLRVVRLDGGRPMPLAVVVRTLLLCLAVPPLFSDRDWRGLHDRAAGTLVIRA